MDILIDRVIGNEPGELSSGEIKRQLAKANGEQIVVRIHSEGGSVIEGLAMFDAFKAYPGPKKCLVESAAFSMASVLAMAFDDRQITPNGYLMLHAPYMDDNSAPQFIASLRDRLSAIYAAATKRPRAFIDKLMSNETFLDSTEALRNGFATSISQGSPRAVALMRDMVQRHDDLRAVVLARLRSQTTATARWRGAVLASMAGGLNRTRAIIAVDKTNPGLRLSMIQEANAR